MKIKIAYCIPGLYYPSGMERVLSLKANYLASQKDKYEIYIILTEGKDKTPYYPLLPEIQLIHLDINFDDLYTVSPIKKLAAIFKNKNCSENGSQNAYIRSGLILQYHCFAGISILSIK